MDFYGFLFILISRDFAYVYRIKVGAGSCHSIFPTVKLKLILDEDGNLPVGSVVSVVVVVDDESPVATVAIVLAVLVVLVLKQLPAARPRLRGGGCHLYEVIQYL